MDALVDLEIAELEILMEQQNIPPEAGPYGGEVMYTPELFLSNTGTPYSPDFDPFEAEWLAQQLAPETLVSNVAATKSNNVFNENDDEDEDETDPLDDPNNDIGGANYEVYVHGTLVSNNGGNVNSVTTTGIDHNGPGGANYEVIATGTINRYVDIDQWSLSSYFYSMGLSDISDLSWAYGHLDNGELPFNAQLFELIQTELDISLTDMMMQIIGEVNSQMIDLGVLIPADAASVVELAEQLDELTDRVAELEATNADLEEQLSALTELFDNLTVSLTNLITTLDDLASNLDPDSDAYQSVVSAINVARDTIFFINLLR